MYGISFDILPFAIRIIKYGPKVSGQSKSRTKARDEGLSLKTIYHVFFFVVIQLLCPGGGGGTSI